MCYKIGNDGTKQEQTWQDNTVEITSKQQLNKNESEIQGLDETVTLHL